MVFSARQALLATGNPDDVVATVTTLVNELRADSVDLGETNDVVGLGVTLAGLVDGPTGAVYFAPDLDGPTTPWRQVPLETLLQERTQLRTAVENDANALAMHQYLLGGDDAGLGVVLLSRSGEGVGGGMVVNGQATHGVGGIAGEIGHLVVDPDGEPCRCKPGARGCLETVASSAAILRRSAAEGSAATANLSDLAKLVQAGDLTAIAAIRTAGAAFAHVIAHMISIVGPQRIVLFGPPELVSEETASGKLFAAEVRRGEVVSVSDVKIQVDLKVLGELTEAKAAAAAAVHHFLSRPRQWVPDIAGSTEGLLSASMRSFAIA
jgi:predicted NBD/HSP70 family sugar kinase